MSQNQYVLRFIGKISTEGQINGLPPEIFGFILFEGDDKEHIDRLINGQLQAFINSQGMAVQKEQGAVIDLRQTPADRMFVPIRWIVSISADVKRVIGEISQPDESGVERLFDGKSPVKQ